MIKAIVSSSAIRRFCYISMNIFLVWQFLAPFPVKSNDYDSICAYGTPYLPCKVRLSDKSILILAANTLLEFRDTNLPKIKLILDKYGSNAGFEAFPLECSLLQSVHSYATVDYRFSHTGATSRETSIFVRFKNHATATSFCNELTVFLAKH